jgi:hypothetical protein
MSEARRPFAADQVADAAEDHGAERTHQEAGGVSGKGRQQRCRGIFSREEQCSKERCQDCVEIKVVPFKYRAERRCEDDEFLVLRHAADTGSGTSDCAHLESPLVFQNNVPAAADEDAVPVCPIGPSPRWRWLQKL